MRLIPLPAFQDNDLCFPGDAQPILVMRQMREMLAVLRGKTRVGHTHEYTLGNLKSALAMEPDNLQLVHYNQRREGPRANPDGFK